MTCPTCGADVRIIVDEQCALVVLATIAVAAGLAYANITLWVTVPAFLVLMLLGEVGARQLARLKARQEVPE